MSPNVMALTQKVLAIGVEAPIKARYHTPSWRRHYTCRNNSYHRGTLLERGRTDFSVPLDNFTPEDKVLLYCRYYMPMHIYSNYHVFQANQELLAQHLCDATVHPLFIDFGCGPLSAGLGFSSFYGQCMDQQRPFTYIGIDHADAMLSKAREFSRIPGVFHPQSRFDFLKNFTYLPFMLGPYVQSSTLIMLNFSYFFASYSVDPITVARTVRILVQRYGKHKILVFHQNPPSQNLNEKWRIFKEEVKDLFVVVNKQEETVPYCDPTSQKMRNIKLYHETIANWGCQ
jgi:hypothetical protein